MAEDAEVIEFIAYTVKCSPCGGENVCVREDAEHKGKLTSERAANGCDVKSYKRIGNDPQIPLFSEDDWTCSVAN